MNSEVKQLAAMRQLLFSLERELGLDDMNQHEKDIFYAFHTLAAQQSGEKFISSESVRTYETVRKMKHATYHRAMKRLLDNGVIEHAPQRKSGLYQLSANAEH
ncbi:MarR family transcriptional regulator [Donghicola eburneus]|jgi:hypothetical protein|uniref:MarR family transcriptional regulator n=1 Tax=Donghicola eburneus TaxID=393278 RepID=UPI0008E24C44|nr:MarR family transcriptional regulator [Donghicola eburneus]SFQ77689.1 hypothetical protein SAMN05421764_1205 [Donghicola eburneus]